MMKNHLTIAWNVIIALFIGLAAFVIVPKIIGQFQWLDRFSEGALRDRVVMMGFQGIGLLMVIAFGAFSLSSVFWRKVSWGWRGLFIGVLVSSVGGVVVAIQIDQANMGLVAYGDYLAFLIGAAVIVFPIALVGVGYPKLLLDAWRRILGRRQDEPSVAPNRSSAALLNPEPSVRGSED